MPNVSVLEPVQKFTISIRTIRGPLTVHVEKEVLCRLGADDVDQASQLQALDLHMPRIHALALQLAARATSHEVTVAESDVWWNADEGKEHCDPHATVHRPISS